MFFQQLGAWFLSLLVVFGIGVNTGRDLDEGEVNPELKQKITEHMDVIVDEMALMADDINAEVNKKVEAFKESDFAKQADAFCTDVKEIMTSTWQEIVDRFGPKDDTTDEKTLVEEAAETVEEAVEETAETVEDAVEEATETVEDAVEAPETEEAPAVETESTPG